jgi:hypothetical protein
MEYYTKDSLAKEKFIKIHKFLFSEEFRDLSCDAKMVYGILRDRLDMSIRNNWIDKDNNVYCIFPNKDLAAMMGKGVTSIIKYKKELKDYGFLKEKRTFDNPNMIYVLRPRNVEIYSNFEYCGYVTSKSETTEFQKVKPNKTNNNKTDINKTNITDIAENFEEFTFSDESTSKISLFKLEFYARFNQPYRKTKRTSFNNEIIKDLDIDEFPIYVRMFFDEMDNDINKCTIEYMDKAINRLIR